VAPPPGQKAALIIGAFPTFNAEDSSGVLAPVRVARACC